MRLARHVHWVIGFTLVVMLAPVSAQAITINVIAHDDERGGYTFEIVGVGGPNPDLVLAPGDDVVIRLTNEGSVEHNFHIGAPVSRMTGLIEPGASAELSFTVPADAAGEAAYWCDPHKNLGMQGRVRFETPSHPSTPSTVEGPGGGPPARASPTPFPPPSLVILAMGALAAVSRSRRPPV